MPTLRSATIHLAHENPDLRPHLLPILTATKKKVKDTFDAARWDMDRVQQLAWVDNGEVWARELWRKNPKVVDDPKFNPEEYAAELRADAMNEEEAESGMGWSAVQHGFVAELEKLSGKRFRRDVTQHAHEDLAKWNTPSWKLPKKR